MNFRRYNSAAHFYKFLTLAGLVTVLLFFATPTIAQNTKGDRAEVGGSSGPRKTRFKGQGRKKNKNGKNSFNRVTPGRFSLSNAARSLRKVGKPSNNKRNVYSQYQFSNNPSKKPKDSQRSASRAANRSRVVVKSRTGRASNVYPQHDRRYFNNNSSKPRNTQHSVSNRSTLARLKRLQSTPPGNPSRRRKVVPQSASRSYIRHKSINSNARFWNVKRKGEVATVNDLAGRPLRAKNYQTPRPAVLSPTYKPYFNRKRIGDKPYKGPAAGHHISASKYAQGAWKGDIAQRKIRGRNFSSKSQVEGNPILGPRQKNPGRRDRVYRGSIPGSGYKSASQPPEKRTGITPLPGRTPGIGANGVGYAGRLKGRRPLKGGGSRSGRLWNNNGIALQGRTPGIGANGVGNFQGNLKGYKPLKGGGSRSGKRWNNNGMAIQGRTPGVGANGVGTFQGNLKGYKPLKGGGSRSGKRWNNNGMAIQGRAPGIGANGVGTFQGNLKGYKPLKGGGSRSGKRWNNNGMAIQGRAPGIGANGVGTFQGNLKGYKPLKGGGSRSGKQWNNKGVAIQGRTPGIGANGLGTFQGNIKTGRPLKGGGSISGRLWNNKGTAIPAKPPSAAAAKASGFPGKILQFDLNPTFSNQGEEFTGFIKAKKPLKGGGSVSGKLWNNKQTPIPSKTPSPATRKAAGYPGNLKMFEESPGFSDQGEEFTGYIRLSRWKRNYLKDPYSAELALKKRRTNKTTYDVDNLQVKLKRRDYVVNKNLPETATRKLKPTAATNSVANLQIKVQRRAYVVNKNISENATKKLKPTQATNDVGNLQIKVQQYNYIHNASSAKEALRVREPGKAFARSTDYQGNIRMKKFDLTKLFSEKNRALHPDAKFVKLNKNNVDDERDFLTNVKLWWARTFRKNDTQPTNLKEKEKKPRYDKGEQGLWNE